MSSHSRLPTTQIALAAAFLASSAFFIALQATGARAQDPVLAPGQVIVTGFPGVVEPIAPPEGSDPLDHTFIDLDGASMAIRSLEPEEPPHGEPIAAPSVFAATAADVGLVFGMTLDNAPEVYGADAPNIYLAATSAFGLHIVVPDAEGNPVRSADGAPDATYMDGQWGAAGGVTGYPGSIWKVDGETGEVTLFTTIAANSGAGLGDIVYDPSSAQFFVSDLDMGLIYRLAEDGVIIDTFDHGVDARPTHDLDPVPDDGTSLDITDPAFSSEDPATWGITPADRRVHALAVFGSRLYYSTRNAEIPQIWSVRIEEDGSFGPARWELDVADLLSADDVTDILFDPQGRMILAQRGARVGSYDYSSFAEPGTSSVVRYAREYPDDPETPGTWVPEPDSYAIGNAPDGANATGGIALGPNYDEETGAFDGACDAYLWASGDALRDNLNVDDPLDPPVYLHGLQGMPASIVRPVNDPPILAAFVDFDGVVDDEDEAETLKRGHVGAVAFWQQCEAGAETYVPPPVFDEDDILGEEDDEDADEDEEEDEFVNLTLKKWASPFACADVGLEWWCNFTIRVENTGDDPYFGPVVVDDYLPDNNPGASLDFWPDPPWNCNPTGPTSAQCVRGPVLLFPNDSVVLHEVVKLPKAAVDYCHLFNEAELNWFWDDDDDWTDDFDGGVAGIPGPGCGLPPDTTDLVLNKIAGPCFDVGATWDCSFLVTVHNLGPGNFSGPIQVTDTLGVNAPATVVGPWNCAQAGPVLTCDIAVPPVNVSPGWTSGFVVTAHLPKPVAPLLCDLDNEANIASPAAVAPMNQNAGNDSESVVAHVPDAACLAPAADTDLEMQKTSLGCIAAFGGYFCQWQLTFENVGTDPYLGPITFEDSSFGATWNELTTAYPGFCSGPPINVSCTDPLVPLNPGVPSTLLFYTYYPDGPDACSASNSVSIQDPNPGSIQNPAGNDSDIAAIPLPNPACAGLPKVNITKTAQGCYDDPNSEFWLCDFDVQVISYGAVAQPGPIEVHDFNDKPTTFDDPSCVPAGAGVWKCTHPAAMPPATGWSFQAQTQVDPNGVTLADCEVNNTVWITNPLNGDPGHIAHAMQKVPQLFINVGPGPVYVYCDPPSLELRKTHIETVRSGDGYNATFAVRAVSTGPDPYNGTVEVDEDLPDGTSFVSSENWSCVPTIGNDMHCSSTYKHMPVGTYTQMIITIHIPEDVAVASQCNVVNTVNAAISAEVLHSDEGVQYTASAAAEIPARLCRPDAEEPEEEPDEPAPQCPVNRVMPGGDCCEAGTVWNGRQCAEPRPQCPADSHVEAGECVCDEGLEGDPGKCRPVQSQPSCPSDSRLVRGECRCLPGTEGRPGRCTVIEDEEEEDEGPACPSDSRLVRGECRCLPGTEGRPGRCQVIEEEEEDEEPICPDDSRLVRGECRCLPGTTGRPGRCEPEVVIELPICPPDSTFNLRAGGCVCNPPLEGRPGNCRRPQTGDDSNGNNGNGGNGSNVPSCPKDSHFDRRQQTCVCDEPLVGEPGNCQRPLRILPELQLRQLPSIN